MPISVDTYSKRVRKQRQDRNKKKIRYQQTVYNTSDSDSDSGNDETNGVACEALDERQSTISNQYEAEDLFEDYYEPEKYEDPKEDHGDATELDDTPPLFSKSNVRTREAVRQLMTFFIKSIFDKRKIIKIMCVIKSILPMPNNLPITFKQILKLFGKVPSFIIKFYCSNCLTLTTKRGVQHYCSNSVCKLFGVQLSKRQLTEIVTMNIREKLQSVIERNFSLFVGHEELFPAFNISSGSRYQSITKNTLHPITLNMHTDGAPMVRSTKSSLWPCFSSIVELPSPVHEYQSNIMILGLWISCIKPDVNLFLESIIEQLIELSESGTSVFVNEYEFKVNVKTQMFVSDLPAKALFMKTINFNGYYACTNCVTEGTVYNKQVFYPYEKNNYEPRTHQQFLATANEVEAKLAGGGRSISINGIKGLSSLLRVLCYPFDIVYDYMHLICLNHVPTLIKRFIEILSYDDLGKIDSILSSIRLPHDVNVRYNYSILSNDDWKAKNNRLFVLNLGLPILVQYLPTLYSSHLAIYCMFVKILHCPKTIEEIYFADKLIHFYCKTASDVYDIKIALYTLHAHLHLPAQVFHHGALAFSSSFCFKSAIYHIKNKSHGTKHLASQIGYAYDMETIIPLENFQVSTPSLVNEIQIDSDLLKVYRDILTEKLNDLGQDTIGTKLYLRYKDNFQIHHPLLYAKRFSCNSYLVSYNESHHQIHYGNIIIFYVFNDVRYSLIQQYHRADVKISDFLDIPEDLKSKVDVLYPICFLSNIYIVIPVRAIAKKCILVPFQDYQCISEMRMSFEHD